ncbi:translational GTPase TypA, partial [Patescibacteria group bacterium]|nr:translational GTPase TypA [Patescibacteria group bacterium]
VLLVDAAEGPMPQTKFVLKKSLELGLKPILVLNKIDKPAADPTWAQEAVYELFLDLGANDEQLDFQTVYAIGRDGVASMTLDGEMKDLSPILDLILDVVPNAATEDRLAAPLQAQVFNLAYDNFLGRMGIARIYQGKISLGQTVYLKDGEDTVTGKISKLFSFKGLQRVEVTEASAGDIVMIAGIPDIYIGQTVLADETGEVLPAIAVDEPTISMNVFVNDSPFSGKSGKFLTSRQIFDRLERELEVNVGLRVEVGDNGRAKVYGRGELHVAVLVENMRREGFELAISQPEVIIKDIDGTKHEPFEEVTILVPEESSGTVIDKLGKRKGIMMDMRSDNGQTRMVFSVPTRGLLGYRNEFVVDTKGEGILTTTFEAFKPYAGVVMKTEYGSMVSMASGKALGFSLANLQERGTLYIGPGTEVYEGMVVGNTTKGADMDVNPTKGKQLTNMRASGSDEAIKLTPPLELTLEMAMGLMREDEYLEVTPDAIRLRKEFLKESDRARNKRQVK